jgi:predicted GTPase
MPQFSQLSQSSQVRALIMRDGDTGTFKSSLCKELGGDVQVHRSVGESSKSSPRAVSD